MEQLEEANYLKDQYKKELEELKTKNKRYELQIKKLKF